MARVAGGDTGVRSETKVVENTDTTFSSLMNESQEEETSFIDNKNVTKCGPEKDDMIEVLNSYLEFEKAIDVAKKRREERYLSLSEASCRSPRGQYTRIGWNLRTIFLIIFLNVIFLVILFNVYIFMIFPYQ